MARAPHAPAWVLVVGAMATLLMAVVPPAPAGADGPHRRHRHHRAVPRRPVVSAQYRRQRARWHQAPTSRALRMWEERTPPPLVIAPARGSEHFILEPDGDEGGFDEGDVASAARAWATNRGVALAPPCVPERRLLDLVYRAAGHFRARGVRRVGGWRPTRSSSRHSQCGAIDMVMPGTRDERLASWLRREGFVGVGIYPNGGFVHLDVRERSFFWVDRS